MACYHPLVGFPDYGELSKNGKRKYKIEGAYNPEYTKLYPDVIKIPCGKCIGCKLDYSRQWADRMVLELDYNNGRGIFVTLTYNNENIPIFCDDDDNPIGYSLLKRDVQLFNKILRKRFSDRTIRFYCAGEYGAKTHRPHYHMILFGLTLEDFDDLECCGRNELGQLYYTSKKFESMWKRGFVCLSEVSYKTCAYVARYCAKKAFGFDVPEGLEKEFALMSRNPGIGSKYLELHPDCIEKTNLYLSQGNASIKLSVPKYFYRKMELKYPGRYDSMIEARKRFAIDKELLEFNKTNLGYIDYLEVKEEEKLNRTKILFNRKEV